MIAEPFHAFFYVNNLEKSIKFYNEYLGFPLVYSNSSSFTIDFFGHGISFECITEFKVPGQWFTCTASDVDSKQYVPSMHWGINLHDKNIFKIYLDKCKTHEIEFIVPATLYNEGAENEQALFFIKDPTGYVIEFRYMSRRFQLKELKKWDQRSNTHVKSKFNHGE